VFAVDLKFTDCVEDVDFYGLCKETILNHCRGEGCISNKACLGETLYHGPHYWANWLMDKDTGNIDVNIPNFEKGGIDSFFPK